ncbi:MAG TPA: glutamate-1-semialdehyde 2,1-aminomutase, partial [Capsulimonadaceae bacterium]|nr:glutamate-1-semialdehyde 2,1-aminomutase [Capsulimonadaceae bacterium]
MLEYAQSHAWYDRAKKAMPGGVNSPVRSFRSVGGNPFFVERGEGSRIYDVDGNAYIDYVMSWGPLLFGHAPARVVAAIERAARKGTSFGASTPAEVKLAEKIVAMVPSVESVRLVNSGTEAVMSAVRLARGFTGRSKVVKFEGGYHGHSDSLLAKAGSGVATLGLPDSAGVPENLTRDTIVLPYNDTDLFREAVYSNRGEIACVLVEPVAGNMGVVLPKAGFLEALREETERDGALLIFDEVITGFRLGKGGAQEYFGLKPDLTTLGKILGGGLPLAAYGGRAEIMDQIAPVGPVYQAGTLSGNPLAVAAGLAVLKEIEESPTIYKTLEEKMKHLALATREAAAKAGVTCQVNQIASMMTVFFTDRAVTDYDAAKTCDTARYAQFFRALLERGVSLAPSQFEAGFVSTAHSD